MVPLRLGFVFKTHRCTASSSFDLSPNPPEHSQVALTTMQTVTQPVRGSSAPSTTAPEFNPFPKVGIEDALVRSYQVATTTWSPTDNIGDQLLDIRFPEALAVLPAIEPRLAYFTHFRAGVEITVEIIAPPTSAGFLVVAPMPFYDPDTGIQHLNIFQLVQWPGAAVLSASKGARFKTTIPWSATVPFVKTADIGTVTKGSIGSLNVTVLSPLNQPGATSPADVTVNVYASFKDVEVAGYIPFPPTSRNFTYGRRRGKALQKLTPQSKVEGEVRSAKGVLSSVATATSAVAGSLLPVDTPSPTSIPDAIEKAVDFFIPFLDQPASQQAPQPIMTAMSSIHYAHGLFPGQTVSLTPGVTAPDLGSWFGARDSNPTFTEIAMRPGLVRYGAGPTGPNAGILSTASPDSLVENSITWVTPFASMIFPASVAAWTVPIPCGAVAAGFSGWRGTMKYLFKFSAQGMATARVRIVYIPSLSAPPSSIEDYAGEIISKLVDIAGDTDVEFEVPPLINGTYLPVIKDGAIFPSDEVLSTTSSGLIALYVVTPPTTYDSTSSYISWFLFQAASSDFQVMRPFPTFGNVWPSVPPEPEPPFRSKLRSVVDSKATPTHKPQASTSLQSAFSREFPPLMKTTRYVDHNFSNTDPCKCLTDYYRRADLSTVLADAPYVFGWELGLYHVPAPTSDTLDDITWPRYMAACHRGHRGAQRVQVYPQTTTASFYNATITSDDPLILDLRSNERIMSDPPFLALELPYISSWFYAPSLQYGLPVMAEPSLDPGIDQTWLLNLTGMTETFFSAGDDTVFYDWRPCLIASVPNAVSKSHTNVSSAGPAPLPRESRLPQGPRPVRRRLRPVVKA